MKRIWILLVLITIISCNQNKEKENTTTKTDDTKNEVIPVESDGGIGDGAVPITDYYIQSIEKAHKKQEFLKHNAVSFDAKILFGGKEHLEGKITMLTNSTKIRIDKKDGSQLIYDGEKVFLHPEDANDKGTRFDMFTWTYFFGMPYKLSDPGTQWELQQDRDLDKKSYNTAKLTFEAGTGDAPDDWYVIYTEPNTKVLTASAYIVSFGSGGDTAKAEEDPHAIYYKDFTTVSGIPFATKWDFYGWTSEKGITDKLGEAMITNITFIDDEGVIFQVPEKSKEIKL
ncbi:DUF6503 family protein [Aquimarina sp. MMG016]|uniref:DUF6503 family protein n=1 Tax=Aquimarina sp. MMG016 TaxID=2822690 RepID=UPI001B3A4C9A|nr:DUF6503 family protein [Aquimarina sp. MMG016]MBQ4822842.1 hypothetical protein [Aquimarina sp. MMG016]